MREFMVFVRIWRAARSPTATSSRRHGGRDDRRAVVLEGVGGRGCGGGDIQRCARRSLPRRVESFAVSAVYRPDIRAYGRAATRGTHRFPAGETGGRENVAGA